jgi:hypothetical protein
VSTERPRGLIPGAGRRGPSRALESVVSVRFDAALLADVRKMAGEDGQSVSDWIRNAVWLERTRREMEALPAPAPLLAGWSCRHLSVTAAAGTLARPTSACGCVMWPIYATRNAA